MEYNWSIFLLDDGGIARTPDLMSRTLVAVAHVAFHILTRQAIAPNPGCPPCDDDQHAEFMEYDLSRFFLTTELRCPQVGMTLFNIGLTYGFTSLGNQTGNLLPSAYLNIKTEPGSPVYNYG